MKQQVKQLQLLFRLTVICIWLSAAALCSVGFLPMISDEVFRQMITYTMATIFWVTAILAYLLFWMTNVVSVNQAKRLKKTKERKKIPCGLFRFYTNAKGTAADIGLILSIIFFVLTLFRRIRTGWMPTAALAAVYLTVHLHGLYNGRNYKFIKRLVN
ncbi:MAG: hypothetical protein IJN11_09220 [Oscillospiraceae bacterium]|nr:hypothetical protein [Oscillospiraceae bacterium]